MRNKHRSPLSGPEGTPQAFTKHYQRFLQHSLKSAAALPLSLTHEKPLSSLLGPWKQRAARAQLGSAPGPVTPAFLTLTKSGVIFPARCGRPATRRHRSCGASRRHGGRRPRRPAPPSDPSSALGSPSTKAKRGTKSGRLWRQCPGSPRASYPLSSEAGRPGSQRQGEHGGGTRFSDPGRSRLTGNERARRPGARVPEPGTHGARALTSPGRTAHALTSLGPASGTGRVPRRGGARGLLGPVGGPETTQSLKGRTGSAS